MKKGWTYKKLGELYPIIMGKTPPRNMARFWDTKKETHNLWVSIADLSKNEGKEITDTKEYISDEAVANITKIAKGSLLVSFKLTLGKMAFAGDDLYTNEAIMSLGKRDDINLKFLYYYFSSLDWGKLAAGNEKVKGKTLNKKSLSEVPVAYLPLSEQQRIVSRLDAAFAHINELKANAEKQLNEARALFQKALAKAMEPKDGWEENTIGELFKTYAGGTPLKSENLYYEGGKIPWIRSGEVCQKYIKESEMYITEEGMKNSSAKFYPINTVLVAMYGATAAQVGILKFEATSNQAVCGILPHKDFVPEYIYYWFRNIEEDLAAQAQGGAQPNLSQVKIKKVTISYPSFSEQQRIVARLDSLSAHVRELEEISKKTIAECDALKQALLRKVFE